jgi:hypothetical protein
LYLVDCFTTTEFEMLLGFQDVKERSGVSVSHNKATHETPDKCTAIATSSTLMPTVYKVLCRIKGQNRTVKAVFVLVRFKSRMNLGHFLY